MNKEELWARYVKKNPTFVTEGARFTATGLRKFFDQTYDQGLAAGGKTADFGSVFQELMRK